MQFQPPTKSNDVSVPISSNPGENQGTDQNGIVTGRWKTGLFGCMDTMVPNALMSICCPAVSVAQITARLGLVPFYHVIGVFAVLYFFALLTAITHSGFLKVITVLISIAVSLCCVRLRWRIRLLFQIPGSPCEDLAISWCCGCCSIAQMASHVESYEPGNCGFAPRGTLEGYSW